jgi:histidinol dehydrogenase
MSIQLSEGQTWQWKRTQSAERAAMETVQRVIEEVRLHGDQALRQFTAQFDGCAAAGSPDFTFTVSLETMRLAWESQPRSLQKALQAAAERIRHFHTLQTRGDIEWMGSDGETVGMTWRPLARVGVYAPGGRAAYPSTVLMNVIPAQVAGVREIALVSPPQQDTGLPHPLVLAAAHMLGVREVYRAGGAQAIAALAYGTDEIPPVDKITGPGNLYVALAKRAVMGDVGIDSIAGPSEVFIVADEQANPAFVAADMLAQTEHDPEAGAVCLTTSSTLAAAVQGELSLQLDDLSRREIAARSLSQWGAIVLTKSLDEAIELVNANAPEHVELMVEDAKQWLPKITSAGAVFLGAHSPEPVGDYYAGSNHTLPTHGSARFTSGLGVDDFLRRMTYVEYTEQTLARHAMHITELARAEGLDAHGKAVQIRLTRGDNQ